MHGPICLALFPLNERGSPTQMNVAQELHMQSNTDTFLLENTCLFQVYSLLAKGPMSFLHYSLYYGSFALFMEPSFPLTQDPDYTPLPTAFQVFNLWDMISGLCAAPLNLTFSGTRHLTSCSTWVLRIDQPSMPQLISRH